MWWPEAALRRILAGIALGAALLAGAACTVQPLHGTRSTPGADALSSVEVAEVGTRHALEVRNHLIFLMSGGAGQPASPAYRLDLAVDRNLINTGLVQVATDNEYSAGTVVLTGEFVLRDRASGDIVARGRRSASASFDHTRQEFAHLRAVRDAENRAARELAEMLRFAVAQELIRAGRR